MIRSFNEWKWKLVPTVQCSVNNGQHVSHHLSLHFNGHFPDEPGLAAIYWSKGWRKWWRQLLTGAMSCKAPVKWSPPTNQQAVFFYRPDALPVAQPTASNHWREKYHIPWTCLSQAHLGVFQLCLWPLIVPVTLGDGCHASHQPSDASTPCVSHHLEL